MKKAAVMATVFFLALFTLPCETGVAETPAATLYVGGDGPGNYSSVQAAIDNASDGDTVYVYSGIYYENIVIDKMIHLKGEDKENTILDGCVIDNVIIITADNVTVTGFTLQRSGDVFPKAGINISSNYNNICGNIVKDNFYGVTLFYSSNNNISDNDIMNNDHCGIYMSGSSNNVIKGNNIKGHTYNGIGVYDNSNGNNITKNTLMKNNYCGVNIRGSYYNNIVFNTVTNNKIGIHLPGKDYHNRVSGNTLLNNDTNIEEEFKIPGFEIFLLILASVFVLLGKRKKIH
jgi:parallel beta-helix repeat protein